MRNIENICKVYKICPRCWCDDDGGMWCNEDCRKGIKENSNKEKIIQEIHNYYKNKIDKASAEMIDEILDDNKAICEIAERLIAERG